MSDLPTIHNHPILHQTTDARELHVFLEIRRDFSSWVKAQIKRADLIENKDFIKLTQKGELSATGQTSIEYHLTIAAGKDIAMMSNSEKGKEVRRWYRKCEAIAMQQVNHPAELTYDELIQKALIMSSAKIHALQEETKNLETQVEQIKPKAAAYDRIADTTGNICITDVAKVLHIPPKKMFAWLNEHNWIFRRMGTSWLAYQTRIEQGVLEHKVVTIYTDGMQKIREQVLVTPKGLTKLAEIFELEVIA